MIKKSRQHLKLSRITYWSHMAHSGKNGVLLILLGISSIVHAIVPAWFDGTAPMGIIKIFYHQLVDHPHPRFQNLIAHLERKRRT